MRLLIPFLLAIPMSCSSTPEKPELRGTIADGTYTAVDRSFSVVVPHTDAAALRTMQVKEDYTLGGAYVSFGPCKQDQTIYRLLVPKAGEEPVAKVALELVAALRAQFEAAYGGPMQCSSTSEDSLGGRRAFYWQFTQDARASDAVVPTTHDVYVMDLDGRAALVWVQTRKGPRSGLGIRAFAASVALGGEG